MKVDFGSSRIALLLGLVLYGVVFWVFSPALQNDFVGYDDPAYVTTNDRVQQGLTAANIQWAFQSTKICNWHPVTWLSHMLDCQLFGLKPWGHHLSSILLHALNSVLVFWILRVMTGATWRSLIVALLFALHPLRVESVAWVSERKDVLSTTFWILSLWAYLWHVKKLPSVPGRKRQTASGSLVGFWSLPYSLALLLFCLGLMCKQMLVTMPCVLLLLDYWPLNRFGPGKIKGLLVEKIPFLLMALIMSGVIYAVQSHSGVVVTYLGLDTRLENALVAYNRYLFKLVWPTDLTIFYPYPEHWPTGAGLISAILLLSISAGAVIWRRQKPWVPVGWLWFLGTLVPVIGLIQAGEQSMADRYTYLPSLGILVLTVWTLHQATSPWRQQQLICGTVVAGLLVACVGLTRHQIGYWHDTETLFRHAIQVTRINHVAHHCLGLAYVEQGRFDEAIHEFQEVLEQKPGFYYAHCDLGSVYVKRGELNLAAAQFREALAKKPDYADGLIGLGVILDKQGQFEEAVQQLQRSLAHTPDSPRAHDILGTTLGHQGHLLEAIRHYRQALELDPYYMDSHYNLGIALGRLGHLDEAIAEFEQTIRLKPDLADTYKNLGVALERKGAIDAAIDQYRKAVELKPDFVKAHLSLGVALCRKGKLEDGIAELKETLRLKPDYIEAQRVLEIASRLKHTSGNGNHAGDPSGGWPGL